MTLEQAARSIGRTVVYLPSDRNELGVITSVTADFVFVRFVGKVVAAATRPEHLELQEPEVRT